MHYIYTEKITLRKIIIAMSKKIDYINYRSYLIAKTLGGL